MSENSRVRVTLVGVVIVALFSSLLARLWFLQMGPEQNLRAEAIALSTRRIVTESPRGRILDRNGMVLAQDRAAWAVTVQRNMKVSTSKGDRLSATGARVMGQLSELLGVPEGQLTAAYFSKRQSPLLPAVVALDVSQDRRLAILEHQEEYPGVAVVQLTVREYPAGTKLLDPALAAQVLGYVGEINADQLKHLKSKGYQPGDLIGRDGVEAAYESVLRGVPQIETVQVDPTGKQVGPANVVQPGTVGDDVYLSINANWQLAAERALQAGLDRARTLQDQTYKDKGYRTLAAPAGSVVVLDAHNGQVLAMASNPSFPPQRWVGGISQSDLDGLLNPANHYPLVNRATQGQYAPGSAFKLVTSVAETKYGIRTPFTPYDDTGSIIVGADKQRFSNDNNAVNGTVDLSQAITVSSDTYFYSAGDAFWNAWNAGDNNVGLGMQEMAREFGFGSKTGIEIDEQPGRVPDPTWKKNFADSFYKNPIDKQQNGAWNPGDEVHLAVGQGDMLVTPLQLADAYATFANGGALLAPHVGMVVKDGSGHVVRTIDPKPRGLVSFDPVVRAQMLQGFENVTQNPKGTAAGAFRGFPFQLVPGGIAGKTGTAQVYGKAPTSVFASFFPAANPQYVVVAMIEEAGHGAQVAAPVVREVIESMLGLPVTPIATISGND